MDNYDLRGDSFNIVRKAYHLAGLLIPIVYLSGIFEYLAPFGFWDTSRSLAFYVLLGLTLFLIVMEILRFNTEYWRHLFLKKIGPMLKNREINKVHGSLPFIFAAMIVVGFFPREISSLVILFLLFGDPAAAYFGEKYGTVRLFNGKSLQGTLAGIIGAFIVGVVFLFFVTVFPEFIPNSKLLLWQYGSIKVSTWIILIVGSIAAFLFELISGKSFYFDDNITIPLGAGSVMSLLLALVNGQPWNYYFFDFQKLLVPLSSFYNV